MRTGWMTCAFSAWARILPLDLTDPYYSRFTSAEPVILRYDCREWKKSAYMAELCLGRGRILATTLRLEGGMGKQPLFITNNTLGRHLLMSAVLDLYRQKRRAGF